MTWLKQYALYLKAAAVAVLLGLLTWAAISAYSWAYDNGHRDAQLACNVAKLELAEAAVADLEAARAKEQAATKRMAEIEADTQQRLDDAQSEHDRLVAGLRAGNVKLRDHWQAERATDALSDAATAARWADEAAELRAKAAGRIVAAGAECDAQVRGLQEVVKADRQ